MIQENQIEVSLITKFEDLKYTYRPDIRDREALEQNFREKLQVTKFVAFSRMNEK